MNNKKLQSILFSFHLFLKQFRMVLDSEYNVNFKACLCVSIIITDLVSTPN